MFNYLTKFVICFSYSSNLFLRSIASTVSFVEVSPILTVNAYKYHDNSTTGKRQISILLALSSNLNLSATIAMNSELVSFAFDILKVYSYQVFSSCVHLIHEGKSKKHCNIKLSNIYDEPNPIVGSDRSMYPPHLLLQNNILLFSDHFRKQYSRSQRSGLLRYRFPQWRRPVFGIF